MPPRKSYGIRLLLTHMNACGCTISMTNDNTSGRLNCVAWNIHIHTISAFLIIVSFQGIINFPSVYWVSKCLALLNLYFGFCQRLARRNQVRYGTWEAWTVLITATTATNVSKQSKTLSASTTYATATVTTTGTDVSKALSASTTYATATVATTTTNV